MHLVIIDLMVRLSIQQLPPQFVFYRREVKPVNACRVTEQVVYLIVVTVALILQMSRGAVLLFFHHYLQHYLQHLLLHYKFLYHLPLHYLQHHLRHRH